MAASALLLTKLNLICQGFDGGDCIGKDEGEKPLCAGSCLPADVQEGWNPLCAGVCGDGVVNAKEKCDDSNTADGDGCSATCAIETGFWCTEDAVGKSTCSSAPATPPSPPSAPKPSAPPSPAPPPMLPAETLKVLGGWGTPLPSKPLGACEGDCDSDADCMTGLACFQRNHTEDVPGCDNRVKWDSYDFCYDPAALTTPQRPPSTPPPPPPPARPPPPAPLPPDMIVAKIRVRVRKSSGLHPSSIEAVLSDLYYQPDRADCLGGLHLAQPPFFEGSSGDALGGLAGAIGVPPEVTYGIGGAAIAIGVFLLVAGGLFVSKGNRLKAEAGSSTSKFSAMDTESATSAGV